MQVTLIEKPTPQDWLKVKQRALVTMGKSKVINAPDLDWKRKMLNCRHSPIRFLRISFYVSDLPYWVSNELCRHHIGTEKFVKSQRNDRQSDYNRETAPQNAPVNLIVDFNAESFMIFCNKRLCNKASKEMRDLAGMMRDELQKECPEFFGFLIPNCQYMGGLCREIDPCNKSE